MLPFVTITLPSRLIKSASRAEEENLYRLKISLPLTSYDDFLNFLYSARTIKQKRETKKTTEEDHFYLPYHVLWVSAYINKSLTG